MTAACSSGDDEPAATAPLSVRITDAPANSADIDRVCLAFRRITLHYAGGEDVVVDYDPSPAQVRAQTHCIADGTVWDGTSDVPAVRLSALGGPLTVALVDSLRVPVGRITWIRLHLAPGESYLLENGGGTFGMSNDLLSCPSCETTDNNQGRGFKLNRNLEVTSAGLAVTIDVDLGVSLHRNANGYVLRPTARVELDSTLGTIAGLVDPDTIAAAGGALSNGTSIETGCAVYVFPGGVMAADDYHAAASVVTTARVRAVDDGMGMLTYGYAAGALVEGSYAAALTCDLDDPLVDNANAGDGDGVVAFSPLGLAGVVAGQTTTVDF